MVKDKKIRVLFLCTGNSARSIIAEALLNHLGRAEFEAHSAGSKPVGKVNAGAVRVLSAHKIPTGDPRSKSWDDFAGKGAEAIDIVITVCDNAAAEVCPVWPGHPLTLHWGLPDPAAVSGSNQDIEAAFERTLKALEEKILDLLALAAKNPAKATFLEELKETRLERLSA